jgi:hypothetical protein
MPVLVHYRLTDGAILGAWQAATEALLQAQTPPPQDGATTVMVETDVPLVRLVADYAMHEGALQPKTVLTLTATPASFVADGVAVCTVSVDPFVPCTLLVDGTPYTLSLEDPAVELTADVPHTFTITLAASATASAPPLTVEAT